MFAFNYFAAIILIYLTVGTCEDYCNAETKTCDQSAENNKKLLFYDVNPQEGFNLKRDVYMRFAIAAAERNKKLDSSWNIVLPPWYRLYHWKSQDYWNSNPVPWKLFFDLDAFGSFTSVMDITDAFMHANGDNLVIDRVYALENFPDAFENGRFVEKWKVRSCDYEPNFWSYTNISAREVICVQFQGKASKLFEVISLHPNDKKVMFTNGEIALHDEYGSKKFWDCRKSMKFNKKLINIADNYIRDNFKCNQRCNYLSVHWRRQDFARGRSKQVPSINGTANQIHRFAKNKTRDIFIATDAHKNELNMLKSKLEYYNYNVFHYEPSNDEVNVYKDGGIAIIDQIICSKAAFFVGTHESTFTFRIQEEREIMGYDSDTTFNRLCPDTGKCETMSKWTIVN